MTSAMILCAGFGTRLGDLTKDTPKPMLELEGKPILEHTILHLKKLGIENIVINLHYLADKITSYFNDGKKFGINITYSYEEKPLGTAGALKKVEKHFKNDDNFLLLYGDIISNQNYSDLLDFHISKNDAIATIILHERAKSNSIVEMDNDNKIVKFIERPTNATLFEQKTQNWVNSGLYCFNKKIFDFIPANTFCDFPSDIFSKLVEDGNLYGYPLTGYRCAIDSEDRYNCAQKDYSNNCLKYENQKYAYKN